MLKEGRRRGIASSQSLQDSIALVVKIIIPQVNFQSWVLTTQNSSTKDGPKEKCYKLHGYLPNHNL